MTPTLILYTRAGCCLCEDAQEVLLRVRRRHPFELEVRDIERDEAWHRAYLERIPVVVIDGEGAFELFVDEGELEKRLTDARLSNPVSRVKSG
jgi:glutaredoxin